MIKSIRLSRRYHDFQKIIKNERNTIYFWNLIQRQPHIWTCLKNFFQCVNIFCEVRWCMKEVLVLCQFSVRTRLIFKPCYYVLWSRSVLRKIFRIKFKFVAYYTQDLKHVNGIVSHWFLMCFWMHDNALRTNVILYLIAF